jgi:hypothetical protein
MALFMSGNTVSSADPTIVVENLLQAGNWTFRLVCVDDAGNESEPADLTVIVREPTRINPDIFRDRILVREPIEREPIFRRPIAATRFRPLRPGG